jgi:hypothetical protein
MVRHVTRDLKIFRIEVPCDNLDDVKDGYKDDGFRTPTKKASVPKVSIFFI